MGEFLTDKTVFCSSMMLDDYAEAQERGLPDLDHLPLRTATVTRDGEGRTRCSYCGEIVKVTG